MSESATMTSSKRDWLIGWLTNLALVAALGFLAWRIYPIGNVDNTGPMAPDFSLETMEGGAFRLSEHKGKVVVLNFWATWCPPCRAEMPGYADLYREMNDLGVLFVGLSHDDEGFGVVEPFVREKRITYPVVIDDGGVARLFDGIDTLPTTILVDRQGRIRYRHEGFLMKGALRRSIKQLLRDS